MPNGKHGKWELIEVRITLPIEGNTVRVNDAEIVYKVANFVEKEFVYNHAKRLPHSIRDDVVKIEERIRAKLDVFKDILGSADGEQNA